MYANHQRPGHVSIWYDYGCRLGCCHRAAALMTPCDGSTSVADVFIRVWIMGAIRGCIRPPSPPKNARQWRHANPVMTAGHHLIERGILQRPSHAVGGSGDRAATPPPSSINITRAAGGGMTKGARHVAGRIH